MVLRIVQRHLPKLTALVCYYPDMLVSLDTIFATGLKVMLHVIEPYQVTTSHKTFVYPESKPGFAGIDFETYDRIAAGLAWSRTLGLLRQRLGVEVDLESIWDNHTERKSVLRSRMRYCSLSVLDFCSRICEQGCRCNHGDHGNGTVCQSHPDLYWRYWI